MLGGCIKYLGDEKWNLNDFKNVINAIKMGNKIRMKTFAIVGFNGGKCIKLAKNKIHFNTACPKKVAKLGYESLKDNITISIPGFINKFIVFLNRILPRSVSTKIVRYIQEKNRN